MQERCKEIGVIEDPTRLMNELIGLAREAANGK